MKGWKTVLFGFGVAVAPPAIEYLGSVDWTATGLSPTAGAIIGSAIVALRAVTTTSIGKK